MIKVLGVHVEKIKKEAEKMEKVSAKSLIYQTCGNSDIRLYKGCCSNSSFLVSRNWYASCVTYSHLGY